MRMSEVNSRLSFTLSSLVAAIVLLAIGNPVSNPSLTDFFRERLDSPVASELPPN